MKTLSSEARTSLAIFDSGLHQLKLPILRPVSFGYRIPDESEQPLTNPRRESVALLLQKYFEWIGLVGEGELPVMVLGHSDTCS